MMITKQLVICQICMKEFNNLRALANHNRWHNLPQYSIFQQKIKNRFSNENNPTWKGNKAGYHAIHTWIRTRKPKPERCEDCDKKLDLDLANISGKYKRDINDYKWLCSKCHFYFDADKRKSNLYQFSGRPPITRKVIKLNKEREIVERYNSIKEASEKNDIFASNIHDALNKKQKTSGGFIWEYDNENL